VDTCLTVGHPTAVPSEPAVDVVIPCYNEVKVLRGSVEQTLALFDRTPGFRWRIVIADNGSTDGTGDLARQLEAEYAPRVKAMVLPIKGRGFALREAWLASDADVVAYMDVDLSTDLEQLPDLVRLVTERGCDVAIGSRLARGAQTKRSLKREITSRGYVALIRVFFPRLRITDAQCGFKALRREVAQELVRQTRNGMWFFDTELLILAYWAGYRICELPVRWVEDPDTKVKILRTALEDIRGLCRMRWAGWRRSTSRKAV
jgi:glycosyltransferase involved in cell wall biosynthesis